MRESLSGVGVLDKVVSILDAVEGGPCTLAELQDRSGLPRATAHRLASALEAHGLLRRDSSGAFALGPRLVSLGQAAAGGLRPAMASLAAPILAQLRDETGESAQLYVPSGPGAGSGSGLGAGSGLGSGGTRVCIASLESPHSLRTIVAVGAVLPLDLGSAGKVLSGEAEAARRGWAESVEERELGVASVSAPVVMVGEVVAAISVSGPVERTTRSPGQRYAEPVVRAARALEAALAGVH